tara:strand:- start:138 stop:320 length:183 start_codon:yes stop_codon:yes gene_type:complete
MISSTQSLVSLGLLYFFIMKLITPIFWFKFNLTLRLAACSKDDTVAQDLPACSSESLQHW